MKLAAGDEPMKGGHTSEVRMALPSLPVPEPPPTKATGPKVVPKLLSTNEAPPPPAVRREKECVCGGEGGVKVGVRRSSVGHHRAAHATQRLHLLWGVLPPGLALQPQLPPPPPKSPPPPAPPA